MRALRTLLTALLLANWFACTVHCQLEKTGLFQQNGGHRIAGILPASGSGENEDSRVCDWVASGGFETTDARIAVPEALAVTLAPFLALTLYDDPLSPNSDSEAEWSVTPPELIHTFQFVLRTALPVRAPSLTS